LSVLSSELTLHYGAAMAAFVAALAGSGHCAAMCGPLLFALRFERAVDIVAYHGARLAIYAVFGAVAGAMGASIFSSQYGTGPGVVVAIVALSLLIAVTLRPFLRRFAPGLFNSLLAGTARPHASRAAAAGCATALLPCGWLHLFVASAAAVGNARTGALMLLAFGLGTVPGLSASVGLFKYVSPRLRPWIVTGALVAAVTASLLLKVGPFFAAAPVAGGFAAFCH